MGAPDPRIPEAVQPTSTVTDSDIEEGRQFWSFVKPVKTNPPESDSSWAVNEIDRFVADKLYENGLSPPQDTDPETLLRRLCMDLIGLPPTPEQREKFLDRWAIKKKY